MEDGSSLMPSRSVNAIASLSHHSCCFPYDIRYQPAVLGMLRAAAMAPLPTMSKEPSLSQDCSARGVLDYLRAVLAMAGNWIYIPTLQGHSSFTILFCVYLAYVNLEWSPKCFRCHTEEALHLSPPR